MQRAARVEIPVYCHDGDRGPDYSFRAVAGEGPALVILGGQDCEVAEARNGIPRLYPEGRGSSVSYAAWLAVSIARKNKNGLSVAHAMPSNA